IYPRSRARVFKFVPVRDLDTTSLFAEAESRRLMQRVPEGGDHVVGAHLMARARQATFHLEADVKAGAFRRDIYYRLIGDAPPPARAEQCRALHGRRCWRSGDRVCSRRWLLRPSRRDSRSSGTTTSTKISSDVCCAACSRSAAWTGRGRPSACSNTRRTGRSCG